MYIIIFTFTTYDSSIFKCNCIPIKKYHYQFKYQLVEKNETSSNECFSCCGEVEPVVLFARFCTNGSESDKFVPNCEW